MRKFYQLLGCFFILLFLSASIQAKNLDIRHLNATLETYFDSILNVASHYSTMATAAGKYQNLIAVVPCPKDAKEFTLYFPKNPGNKTRLERFYDLGFFEDKGETHCKKKGPKGYWVYHEKAWHVYRTISKKGIAAFKKAIAKKYKAPVLTTGTKQLRIHCPQDKQKFGSHFDYGYLDQTPETLCTSKIKTFPRNHYAVYVDEHWSFFRTLSCWNQEKCPYFKASLYGMFQNLKRTIYDPQRQGSLIDPFWSFSKSRFSQKKQTAEGYPVYLKPYWYIFAKKDITQGNYYDKIDGKSIRRGKGYPSQTHQFLSSVDGAPIKVKIEYRPDHKLWATQTIKIFEVGVRKLERITRKAFPGRRDPYLILEANYPEFENAGQADTDMMMLSPQKASQCTQTLLHELVHIWNHRINKAWALEGAAEYFGYVLLDQFKRQYPVYVPGQCQFQTLESLWRSYINNKHTDKLLDQQGRSISYQLYVKSLMFWVLLHKSFGSEFTQELFRLTLESKNIDMGYRELKAFVEQYFKTREVTRDVLNQLPLILVDGDLFLPKRFKSRHADDLFVGWFIQGKKSQKNPYGYRIRNAEDFLLTNAKPYSLKSKQQAQPSKESSSQSPSQRPASR